MTIFNKKQNTLGDKLFSKQSLAWFISLVEGLRLKPYHCPSGRLTIGYGRNLSDKGISKSEAISLLQNDLAEARSDVSSSYPEFAKFSSVWKDVLTDMRFNLGKQGLAKFKRFNKALAELDFDLALIEMVKSKWFEQTGRRAKMLWISAYLGEPLWVLFDRELSYDEINEWFLVCWEEFKQKKKNK